MPLFVFVQNNQSEDYRFVKCWRHPLHPQDGRMLLQRKRKQVWWPPAISWFRKPKSDIVFSLMGCRDLTTAKMPDNLEKIGNNTFKDCSSLEDIRISPTVTSIGEYAFSGCSSLTDIQIPDNVTYNREWRIHRLRPSTYLLAWRFEEHRQLCLCY